MSVLGSNRKKEREVGERELEKELEREGQKGIEEKESYRRFMDVSCRETFPLTDSALCSHHAIIIPQQSHFNNTQGHTAAKV